MPPPNVSPPTPVVEMKPLGVASPKACVAWSTSPQVQPPSTRTVRADGSTRIPFIPERSITRPSSQVPSPGPLCPPPRTANVSSCSRAKVDGRDHIGHIHAADDQRGTFLDHAIIDRLSLLVASIAGTKQRRRAYAMQAPEPPSPPKRLVVVCCCIIPFLLVRAVIYGKTVHATGQHLSCIQEARCCDGHA